MISRKANRMVWDENSRQGKRRKNVWSERFMKNQAYLFGIEKCAACGCSPNSKAMTGMFLSSLQMNSAGNWSIHRKVDWNGFRTKRFSASTCGKAIIALCHRCKKEDSFPRNLNRRGIRCATFMWSSTHKLCDSHVSENERSLLDNTLGIWYS